MYIVFCFFIIDALAEPKLASRIFGPGIKYYFYVG